MPEILNTAPCSVTVLLIDSSNADVTSNNSAFSPPNAVHVGFIAQSLIVLISSPPGDKHITHPIPHTASHKLPNWSVTHPSGQHQYY